MIRALSLPVSIIVVATAGGCAFLAPQPDPSHYFLLAPQAASFNDTGTAKDVAVGLGPVKFPAYLERSEIATRVTETRLDYSEHNLWAEPLERNFTRVLSQNVAAQLGSNRVVTHPWYLGNALTYTVPIEVLRFECDGDRTARLDVRWAVKDRRGQVLSTTESHFSEAATEQKREAAVAAQSRTLGQFGVAIAAAIERLYASSGTGSKETSNRSVRGKRGEQ